MDLFIRLLGSFKCRYRNNFVTRLSCEEQEEEEESRTLTECSACDTCAQLVRAVKVSFLFAWKYPPLVLVFSLVGVLCSVSVALPVFAHYSE